MHLVYPLVVASLLFGIGVYGVLARRNAVLVLMSVELMLNAVNLNLVAFDAWWRDSALHSGQVFERVTMPQCCSIGYTCLVTGPATSR